MEENTQVSTLVTDAGGWTIDTTPPEAEVGVEVDEDYLGSSTEEEEAEAKEVKEDDGAAPVTSDAGSTAKEETWQPYRFKGVVAGEEKEVTFKTKEELDKTIARGLVAPKIYTEYKQLKSQMETLKEDAEWANEVDRLAREEPEQFFENVVLAYTQLADEKVAERFEAALADFVHKRYQYYYELAQMSEEQLKMHKQLQAAERIARENARLQELKEEMERKEREAQAARERAEFEGWKQRELTKWVREVGEEHKADILEYMRIVASHAMVQINNGKQYTYKDMSAHLEKLLNPLKQLKSMRPVTKDEEALKQKAIAEKNKETIKALGSDAAATNTAKLPRLKGDALHRGAVEHIMRLLDERKRVAKGG